MCLHVEFPFFKFFILFYSQLDQQFFTKWCYSPDINSFRFGYALNPDSSIRMNCCCYSPWFFFPDRHCFAEDAILMDQYFITNFVIIVHSFIIFTCVAAIRLACLQSPIYFQSATNGMLKSISCPNIAAPGEAFNTVWYVERIAHAALSMNVSMSVG